MIRSYQTIYAARWTAQASVRRVFFSNGVGLLAICLSITVTAPPALAAPPENQAAKAALSPEDLYERIAPSVVTIIVKDENGQRISSGSGFFIEDAIVAKHYRGQRLDQLMAESETKEGRPTQVGYILTNYHVIRPAVTADAVLSNGTSETINWILADDEKTDLVLLSVEVHTTNPVQGIPFSKSDPRVLSTVYAVGSPKGFRGSASDGKVSGYQEISDGDRWLQTTAPISAGSSGGPLVSPDGTVVGVATKIQRNAQNVNFAVPASVATEFLSKTQFRPRATARESSIRFCEREAFSAAHWIVTYAAQQYSEDEKRGAVALEKAHDLFGKARSVADYEQAIAAAQQAEQLLPDDFTYLAYYIAGMAHEGICWTEAHDAWDKTEELYADAVERAFGGPNGRAAIRELVEVTKLKPTFTPGWRELAHGYITRERWADALTASDVLVSFMPRSAHAFSNRAKCYSKLHLPQLAKADQTAAVELAPLNEAYRFGLGRVLSDAGDTTEAIKSYEMALELGYNPAFGQYCLGLAHKKAGNFDKAITAFSTAKDLKYPAASCDSEIAACKQLR